MNSVGFTQNGIGDSGNQFSFANQVFDIKNLIQSADVREKFLNWQGDFFQVRAKFSVWWKTFKASFKESLSLRKVYKKFYKFFFLSKNIKIILAESAFVFSHIFEFSLKLSVLLRNNDTFPFDNAPSPKTLFLTVSDRIFSDFLKRTLPA